MRVSIVTAVFNGRETIEEALDSVARQDYGNVEHVVIDGASSDGTAEFLVARRDGLDVFVSEKDQGIYDALNKGIRLSTGDVVGFLHSDDLFVDENVISKVAAAFGDPAVDAAYGDLVYVSRSAPHRVVRYWRAGEYSPRRLAWGWMPPHPALFVRRRVYERFGAFDTRLKIAADYDCILRFLRGGVVPAYIPEVLVRMRLGGTSNRSLIGIVRKSREDYRALRQNGVGGIGALAWKNLSKVGQFFTTDAPTQSESR